MTFTTLTRPFAHALRALFSLALIGGLTLIASPAHVSAAAAAFTVTFTFDGTDHTVGDGHCDISTNPGDQCTLRAAIMEANFDLDEDVLVLPAGTYTLSIAGADEDEGATGDLDVLNALRIEGSGAAVTAIDGAQLDRVLDVAPETVVEIDGVTFQHGKAGGSPSVGGGIRSHGDFVTLTNSAVIDNYATDGGGLFNQQGTLELINTTVRGNKSFYGGGGIFAVAPVTLRSSTVSGNTGPYYGGGIRAGKTALTLINSTISGNKTAYGGGGISLYFASADLRNMTIVGNTADSDANGIGEGGAIDISNESTVTLKNSILAGNADKSGKAPDCWTKAPLKLVSEGYNLVQNLKGCTFDKSAGDQLGKNPRLGALKNNGGPTFTHAPQGDSPVVDAGDPNGCENTFGTLLAKDQRGVARLVDGNADGSKRCDMGAVEYAGPFVTKLSPGSAKGGSGKLTLTVTGTRFKASSVVRWNNTDLQPASFSPTQLTVQIPESYIAQAGTAKVSVVTPGANGGTSNKKSFTITP